MSFLVVSLTPLAPTVLSPLLRPVLAEGLHLLPQLLDDASLVTVGPGTDLVTGDASSG